MPDSRRFQTKRFMKVALMDDDVVDRDYPANWSYAIGEGYGPAKHRKDLGGRGTPLMQDRVHGTAPSLVDLTCGQRIAVTSHRIVRVLVEQTADITELRRRSAHEVGDDGRVMSNEILDRPCWAGSYPEHKLLGREGYNEGGHPALNLCVCTPHIAHISHPLRGSPRRQATCTAGTDLIHDILPESRGSRPVSEFTLIGMSGGSSA